MKTNPNDSAFAAMSFDSEGRVNESSEGLTKREYFAAIAMQGMLSNAGHVEFLQGNNQSPVPGFVCGLAVEIADALITELNKAK